MKARIESGKVVFYDRLPSIYKSETIGLVLAGFDTLSEEVHQSEGFYDVVTPIYDQYTQELSPIYFDSELKIFTYNVLQLEVPIERPVEEKILTPLEFINRFSDDEAKMILTLTKTSADVELWWIKYNKASFINLNDPQTIGGIRALEVVGIIGEGRANEILTQ